MATDDLERTVRRGVALLSVPLWVLVAQFAVHLRHRANLVDAAVATTAQRVAAVVVAGAVVYLVASGLRQLHAAAR